MAPTESVIRVVVTRYESEPADLDPRYGGIRLRWLPRRTGGSIMRIDRPTDATRTPRAQSAEWSRRQPPAARQPGSGCDR